MSTAPGRAAVLNKLYKVLKKHYKPVAPPAGRTLLEHLLYACCLEQARPEAADEAFAKLLPPCYIDWNEVRVTSKNELAEEVTDKLPDPLGAAANLKQSLQSVFETHFAFDVEFLKKQNLGKSEKDLDTYSGGNPFVLAYVVQHALGGHAIPCGPGALDVLYLFQAINESEHEKRIVPGLERAIPKAKGVEFGSLLHQLGADFIASPQSQRVRGILAEVDPDYKDRLSRLATLKKDEATGAAAKEAERKRAAEAAHIATPPAAAQHAARQAAEAAKKAAAKAEAKGEGKSDAKSEGKGEGKGDAKHDSKHDSKHDAKHDSKHDAKGHGKPAAKAKDAKSEASSGSGGPRLAKKKPR